MQRSATSSDAGILERWARITVRRRGTVLLGLLAFLIGIIALWQTLGGELANTFSLPGTESQRAFDLLEERFPARAGDNATLVFQSDAGLTAPEARARVDAVLAAAATLPRVVAVGNPYERLGGGVSQDGRIAYADVQYDAQAGTIPLGDVKQLTKLSETSSAGGLQVEAGGGIVEATEQEPPGSSEALGLLAAVFILLIAFGSVVAMGLPLITAVLGLVISFALTGLLANVLDFPDFVTAFISLIGIGVGIDYALFIVTRYRESLSKGMSVEESVVTAINTAGRSILFAGMVVAIALLGLTLVGIPFVAAVGIGAAVVVVVAVVLALTLLPALLAYSGRRIDSLRLPFFHANDTGDTSGIWYRLSRMIQRRPLIWALASLVVLLALAFPVLDMRLGFSDAGNGGEELHSRRAYDLLVEGFGPGFNGPFTVVVDTRDAGAGGAAALASIRDAVAGTEGIVQVSPPIPNPAGDAAILIAYPSSSPQDEATQDVLHRLRDQTLPPAVQGSGAAAYVAGPIAGFVDIGDRITARTPWFFAAVIGLSFLLLVVVFRSILVPLKAAIMNLLSIGAAYGVLVAVFQWGWFADFIGVKEGPIEVFLPMMLFATLFGLSMDYEVFLISRIREEYTRTRDNASAVAHGLAVTARVITAAAAIMVVVFLTFVLGPQRIIKEFGIGLATAIFVDATIVRLILVPATMELLGDANWWLPRWLDRLLPRLDVEGHTVPSGRPLATGAADD